jgi:hypothetical protein
LPLLCRFDALLTDPAETRLPAAPADLSAKAEYKADPIAPRFKHDDFASEELERGLK